MCLYLFEGNSISATLSCAVMMRKSSSSTISSLSTRWTTSALPTSSPQLVRVTKISLHTLYTRVPRIFPRRSNLLVKQRLGLELNSAGVVQIWGCLLYTIKDIVHLKMKKLSWYCQEDIFTNVGNQAVSVPIVFHYMFWALSGSQWQLKLFGYQQNIFVFHRKMIYILYFASLVIFNIYPET